MTEQYPSAASKLLDREISEDCLEQWTATVSAKKQETEASMESVLIFRIENDWLALPTSALEEVTECTVIHKIPNRREGVLQGVVNIRGELLLCVSLDGLIGLVRQQPEGNPQLGTERRLLVCKQKGIRVALPVSEVATIHHYSVRDLRNAPVTLARGASCTMGVLYWRDKTVACLDADLMFRSLSEYLE